MDAQLKLRVDITRICREKVDVRLGAGSKRYILSYAAEQWRLGNVISKKGGVCYIEMPPSAKDRREVIWVTELDGDPRRLVLWDISPPDREKRDGLAKYIAEVFGRFVGGVIGSLTS